MGYPDNFSSFLFAARWADRRLPRDLNPAELADIATLRAAIAAVEACKATIAALPPRLSTSPDHEPRHVLMGLDDEIERLRESIAEIEAKPELELAQYDDAA